jgi:hypothetical protein
MDYVCYWDEKTKTQKTRPCTPAEQAEVDARRAEAAAKALLNK